MKKTLKHCLLAIGILAIITLTACGNNTDASENWRPGVVQSNRPVVPEHSVAVEEDVNEDDLDYNEPSYELWEGEVYLDDTEEARTQEEIDLAEYEPDTE